MFVLILIAMHSLLLSPCVAITEDELKTQKSLQRVCHACAYSPEDAKKESTHVVINLDMGFDTWHQDLKATFINPYNPGARSEEVNQLLYDKPCANLHGTGTSGIIHDLSPTVKIVPIIFNKKEGNFFEALDYTLHKAQGDIINLSISLSQEGYIAAPMAQNVKDLFLKAFSQEKVIIAAVGNAFLPMSEVPLTKDLGELAKASDNKLIIVGATRLNPQSQEEIWVDGSGMQVNKADKFYVNSYILGSTYPGNAKEHQELFVSAPAHHYTSLAWRGDFYCESKERDYFGMTSSAAPVVTSFVERLWTHSPQSNAADIGHAIYNGARKNFLGYTPNFYGKGLINYKNSLGQLPKGR